MRIAIYHNLPSGGAKRFAYEEVRRLIQRGHQVAEYTLSMADVRYCDLKPFVERQRIIDYSKTPLFAHRIPCLTPYIHAGQLMSTLSHLRRLSQQIAREIEGGGYDVVFVHDCQVMPSPYVLRYLQGPSVFQCHHVQRPTTIRNSAEHHGLIPQLKRIYYAPARRFSDDLVTRDEQHNIRCATQVLANSQYSRRALLDRYGVESTVIYPGVDQNLFRPLATDRKDYVLAVGALHYMKGYRFLVKAIGRIPKSNRPALFIAANSRDLSEEEIVIRLASDHQVDLHIETIRQDEHLVRVYNQARAFVYAPMQEALGMAPLEAMACGTPVVAVAEAGVLETVRDEETGYLVERDVDQFARKLQSLLDDDPRRNTMGVTAIDYVRSEWTWRITVDRLEEKLVHVLRGG